jgi:hypothetical protein
MSEKGGRASEHHEHVERRTLKSRAPFQQRTKQKEKKKHQNKNMRVTLPLAEKIKKK